MNHIYHESDGKIELDYPISVAFPFLFDDVTFSAWWEHLKVSGAPCTPNPQYIINFRDLFWMDGDWESLLHYRVS